MAERTKKQTTSTTQSRTTECPECGMARNDWPDPEGYTKEGKTFCCEGCAENQGCTCMAA